MKSPTNDGDKATVKTSMPEMGCIMTELLTEEVVWNSHQLRPWPKLLGYLLKLKVRPHSWGKKNKKQKNSVSHQTRRS